MKTKSAEMSDALAQKSDAELDVIFAREVVKTVWILHHYSYSGILDLVLPYLEAAPPFEISYWNGTYRVWIKSPRHVFGEAPRLARAAVLALIAAKRAKNERMP